MDLLHPVEDWEVVPMAAASQNLQLKNGILRTLCVYLCHDSQETRRNFCGFPGCTLDQCMLATLM